jgi:hypothetical protein
MIQRPKNNPRNGDTVSGSAHPRKFKTQKSSNRLFATGFWAEDRILLVDYLGKGTTTTAKRRIALLNKLKQQLCKI